MKCDGGKPLCVHCEKKGQECVYENATSKGARNEDLLLEAVGLLNTLTLSQVTTTLLKLSEETDATQVMNTIRQTADNASQKPDDLTELTGISSFFADQLSGRYPFTYPENHDGGIQYAESLLRELLHDVQYGRLKHSQMHDVDSRSVQNMKQSSSTLTASMLKTRA